MTTDQTQVLRDDIAFMKSLANEGMSTPLVGGPVLMLFGAVFTIGNLVAWVINRFLHLSPSTQGNAQFWLNAAAFGICIIGLPLLIRRTHKQPGYRSPANRAFGMVWAGVGNAIGVMCLVVYLACKKTDSGLPAMVMPSAVMCLYGVGWAVAAAMTRQRFLWIVAIGSYFAALVPIYVWNSPDSALIASVIIFFIAFVPGTVLYLREPKTTV